MRPSDKNSDRRNFLRNLVGGLAATAAVRTWPFRVYSFPTEIIQPKIYPFFDEVSYTSLDKFPVAGYIRNSAMDLNCDIDMDFYQP